MNMKDAVIQTPKLKKRILIKISRRYTISCLHFHDSMHINASHHNQSILYTKCDED